MRTQTLSMAVLAMAPIAGMAAANIVYDEATDGDLSDDPNAPTFVSVSEGNNTVIAVTDREGDDRDIFTFDVAEGYVLSGVILDVYDTNSNDPVNLGFIGFSAGNVLGTDPNSPNPSGLLGYALVSEADSGTDIFGLMALGGGSQGYDGPLAAGPYTFWMQETSPTTDDWTVTLVITQVPAPGVLAMAAVAGLAARRRRG